MNYEISQGEMEDLLKKYPIPVVIYPDTMPWSSQYDEDSAAINYALVRKFQPTRIAEFGARGGRCTHDILLALQANGKKYIYKPYEIEDGLRELAKKNLGEEFGKDAPIVGGDITKATDIPNNLDYLFIDNSHDRETTKWVFDHLIPEKCKPGCLVHFHDIYIDGKDGSLNFSYAENDENEIGYMKQIIRKGEFPLKKVYFTWEHTHARTSTWWIYEPTHK